MELLFKKINIKIIYKIMSNKSLTAIMNILTNTYYIVTIYQKSIQNQHSFNDSKNIFYTINRILDQIDF